MPTTVQVYRATIEPANVSRLLELRPRAIAQAQAACPALLRADLIRLDEHTWLDVLTWSRPEGVDELMAQAPQLPLLGELHSLIGDVLSVDTGELAHSTTP